MMILDRKGSALVGVLLVISVTLLVAVPVLHTATAEYGTAIDDQMEAQAFYLAEAGQEHCKQEAVDLINDNLAAGNTLTTGFPVHATRQGFGPGDYDATAYLDDQGDGTYKLRIESDGIVGGAVGVSGATVVAANVEFPPFSVPGSGDTGEPGDTGDTGDTDEDVPPLDMTLFSADSIEFTGSSWVTGDVITNATLPGKVTMPGTTKINGDLVVGPGVATPSSVIGGLDKGRTPELAVTGRISSSGADPRRYLEYPMPAIPTDLPHRDSLQIKWWPEPQPIVADGQYDSITVESTLTVDVGDAETDTRVIVVKDLEFGGSGKIVLEGDGKLVLCVTDSITTGGKKKGTNGVANGASINLNGDPSRLSVLYTGTEPFAIVGDAKVTGSIYAGNADVQIGNSANSARMVATNGASVTVSGGVAVGMLLYAPKADVSLSGSASVHGAVVCRSILIDGDSSIVAAEGLEASYSELFPGDGGGSGAGSFTLGTPLWSSTKQR